MASSIREAMIYKDCDEYYLRGENLSDIARMAAENQGIETEDAAIVTMWNETSAHNKEICDRIGKWMLEMVQQEA